MSEDGQRTRLGRGLAALIGDVGASAPQRGDGTPRRAPIEAVRPNPRNPRRSFGEAELEELAASIRANGLIQPVVVRRAETGGGYEIVAGERRWRAAQRAGLAEIPVVLVEADDKQALEFAIVENVQRADLNPIEEASGYQSLIQGFGHSQGALAASLGKSRSHVANTLRLLKLPEEVRAALADGTLSAGHGRALLALDDPAAAAREIIARGLTVRDVEAMAKQHKGRPARNAPETKGRASDPNIAALEAALESVLGLPVSIRHGAHGGELRIRYQSVEQLDAVCKSLSG